MNSEALLVAVTQERNEMLRLAGSLAAALIEQAKLIGSFNEAKIGNSVKAMFAPVMAEIAEREHAAWVMQDGLFDWE